ncbi:MAG: VanZ family protein [Methylococcaceae bacterium]|nr:VanZ family protein [Methylococcaceae bacterium]
MNRSIFYAAAAYALFIVYGSLVPLEFKEMPVATALNQFKNIRYLSIGTEHRADWIANILLYIPLAFGASAAFEGVRQPLLRTLLSAGIVVFCIALAVAVEYTQLFFPPRTVSLNDLIAETLGTVIGILGWHFFGAYLTDLYRHLLRGSFLSARAAIIFYLLLYVVLSLFPFDFVTSIAELNAKLAQSNDAFLLPLAACGAEPVRCGVKLLIEILALMPLGLLFCYLPYLQPRVTVNVLIGFFLGLTIEIVQVFLLSGSGQGVSVLTRMVGMGAGAGVFLWVKQHNIADIASLFRRGVWLAVLPYILLVLSINGWFTSYWLTPTQALDKLAETQFLPLYYFYYTSEGVALVSLLSNIGMYLPVGLLCWLSIVSARNRQKQSIPHWFYIGFTAALFALAVETGKLFLKDKHADPSDVWLAFIAAAGFYQFMNRLLLWLVQDKSKTLTERVSESQVISPEIIVESVQPEYEVDKRWRGISIVLSGVIIAALFDYPLAAVWLGLFLVVYAVLLVYFPWAWLVAIPALLPIIDFAPWTGRFFFDEFDLLLLSTLAFYFWQKPNVHHRSLLSGPTILFLSLFSLLYAVSLFKGLLPLPEVNANAFNNYYSNYNGLRVGKGFIWSLLLLPFLQLTVRRYRNAHHYFAYGILLGIASVAAIAILERLVFVSLFDFSSDYRVSAMFSTMHTGGGHIESYLMLSMPFISVLIMSSAHRTLNTMLGIAVFIGGLYTLLVSFSRGGYIGSVVGFVVLLLALLVCFRKRSGVIKGLLLILPLLVIGLLMVLPVLQGNMIHQRFSVIDQDRDSRTYHWRDALAMRDQNLSTTLFGMGLGSYPRTFFWLNTENIHPATYEIANENHNNFLRLRGGDLLFIGQYLSIEPHTSYRLAMDVRGEIDNPALTTSLCEKSLQYSLRCSTVATRTSGHDWKHVEQLIKSNDVGVNVLAGMTRPIQLTIYNGSLGKLIEVDNISLVDSASANLLVNGDFAQGSDRWFFATEKHNPWHIFNFWVHLLFDLGWLGVCSFLVLLVIVAYHCCRKLMKQDLFAAIFLSSFSGFFVVGFVDSAFDAPRLTLLFFLLVYFALIRTPSGWISTQK